MTRKTTSLSLSRGPLSGIKVLDLGTMIAGPIAATLMADFGAEVIKLEKPGGGDTLRHIGPFFKGESLLWNVDGRNKKSVTIDMKQSQGQQLVRELLPRFDVVIENFRPGTLKKWHLDYASLRAAHPPIVMLSISGFGQTGPYADRAAYDRIATAFGGLMHITGFPDRPPVRIGVSMADYLTGLFGAFSVMMALYSRDASNGVGQHIDMALYESIFRFTDSMVSAYDKLGTVRERQGNVGMAAAPGDHFATQDGRYLVLTISNDAMFKRLCLTMNRQDISDSEKYASHNLRWNCIGELNEIVAKWILSKPVDDICVALNSAGLAYSIVLSVSDILADPHYQARGTIGSVESESLGTIRMPGVGPKFSETPAGPLRAAPQLGEHTTEILQEYLGLTSQQVEALRATKTI